MVSRPTASAAQSRADGLSQPASGAFTRRNTRSVIPPVAASAPVTSYRRVPVGGPSAGKSRPPAHASAAAMGTLTKNTDGQPNASTSTPPSSDPKHRPPAPAAPHTARALFRWGPSS